MKNKYCYICMYSESEDKEYYLVDIDNKAVKMALGKGYVWGKKEKACIFASINIAKWYLKDLNNKRAYIKIKE